MTISSSLNAGVMGLSANANRLATISDNIANSATYGYKRSEADFHSMVIGGNGGTYTAGGVNVTTQRLIGEQGALISTSNSTDIAVRGRGMVPVTSEAAVKGGSGTVPMMLATTGSFRTDAEGYLKSEDGLVLMGWPAAADGSIPDLPRDTSAGLVPIKINRNEVTGSPTTKITLGANLPATSTEYGTSANNEVLPVEYFNNLGKSESLQLTFSPTVPALATDPDSNQWTLQITDSATPGAVIGEYVLNFQDARVGGGTLGSVTTTSGGAYDPLTGVLTVTVASGPMEINIGKPLDSSGMTQLGDAYVPGTNVKDGAPVGNMTDIGIDANGYLNAQYDNGTTRRLYQVPLADMANPNGLKSLDGQAYQITRESGGFFLWNAGDGPTGDIAGFAREESSTDVASELTDLIQTQRAYSSNAKVIQTVDEMLQETTNIKR